MQIQDFLKDHAFTYDIGRELTPFHLKAYDRITDTLIITTLTTVNTYNIWFTSISSQSFVPKVLF